MQNLIRCTLLLFLLSLNSHASWLCREASSLAENDYFYACGVASSSDLFEARKRALLNAKHEFNSICNDSYNCKNKEYIITPLRTDCNKRDEVHTCYRGLQFRILDKERKDTNLSVFQLKSEIIKRQNEIKNLERKEENLKALSEVKELPKSEKIILSLEEYKSDYNQKIKEGLFGLNVFYTKVSFDNHSESLFGIGANYESFFFKDIVGLKGNLSYLTSVKNDHDLNHRATPNSQSSPDYHSHKGVDLSLSVPFNYKFASLAPKLGHTSVWYKSTTADYNNFGVLQNTNLRSHSHSDFYYGLNFRYGNRLYIEVETRKYSDHDDFNHLIGVGVQIDF